MKTRPQQLRIKWSKKEHALLYHHDDYSSNSGMLAYYFEGIKWPGEKTLAEELKSRGYDITTLRFTVDKFPKPFTTGETEQPK